MSHKLFGTDGVRGKAGEPPLDGKTVRRLGAALVRALHASRSPRLLVGRDTRESSEWIEREIAHGAIGEGATIVSAGVIPTPAVAYLTKTQGFDTGIMISASHNPFEDNGIKMFSGAGEKFTERLEVEVEQAVADPSWDAQGGAAGAVPQQDYSETYLAHLQRVIPDPRPLKGTRIAIDCANGATTTTARRVFEAVGLDVTVLAAEPNGRNINLHCGSTVPQMLAEHVVQGGYRLGIAFDGDGDRAIFVDARGAIVDGDAVLLMCGKQMKRERRLRGDAVVATVMSNIGLELALRDVGIELIRCPVGDKYVMEQLLTRHLSLGGEQSGHVIFPEFLYTGDGQITALNVLRTIASTGRELADLASELTTYPQVLLNVRVREKRNLTEVPAIAEAMAKVEHRLADHGRLLVRYSGTEPLLRVMLEGRNQDEIRTWAEEIAAAVRQHLG
jgi:phosphoglucosamine mutase